MDKNEIKILGVGDPHIKIDNLPEFDLFCNKLYELAIEENPDIIIVLGDVLDTHERLHTVTMNKAFDMIKNLRDISKTYILVGNHDAINNRIFLNENHWMNAMKEWKNVEIIDKVKVLDINDIKLTLVPYVPNGRFIEALKTNDEEEWKNSDLIFAHQEFYGCKMGAIVSVDGDRWDEEYPYVISGHIHSNQRPQKNIYYPGSAMQNAFGESEKNIIPVIRVEKDVVDASHESMAKIDIQEKNLGLPRKKIVYMDVEDIDNYEPEKINEEKINDKIKVTVSGVYEDFKALKKTKKYKDLVKKGVKIVFKPKKIKEKLNIGDISDDFIDEDGSVKLMDILQSKVNCTKNEYVVQAYELVVNGKDIDTNDIMFV